MNSSPADTPDAPPSFLDASGGRRIAYHKTEAASQWSGPGVVFLGGFRSDMTGTKARWLEDWAKAQGAPFLRFDYTGHGASSGAFEDGAVGDWAEDAFDAIASLTAGPQILVGSSMGGWIALLIAKRAPERLAALVGIAAAPDFTEDSFWANLSDAEQSQLAMSGVIELPSDYSDEPYKITRRLVENGRENLVLRTPLKIDAPVRLLQGTADRDVELSTALQLLTHLECPDATLTLVKDADHRMSEPRELALLGATLERLLA